VTFRLLGLSISQERVSAEQGHCPIPNPIQSIQSSICCCWPTSHPFSCINSSIQLTQPAVPSLYCWVAEFIAGLACILLGWMDGHWGGISSGFECSIHPSIPTPLLCAALDLCVDWLLLLGMVRPNHGQNGNWVLLPVCVRYCQSVSAAAMGSGERELGRAQSHRQPQVPRAENNPCLMPDDPTTSLMRRA
jgi:hypothetical protein